MFRKLQYYFGPNFVNTLEFYLQSLTHSGNISLDKYKEKLLEMTSKQMPYSLFGLHYTFIRPFESLCAPLKLQNGQEKDPKQYDFNYVAQSSAHFQV